MKVKIEEVEAEVNTYACILEDGEEFSLKDSLDSTQPHVNCHRA